MKSVPGEFPVVLTFYRFLSILSRKEKKRQELHLKAAWEGRRVGCRAGGTEAVGVRAPFNFRFHQIVKFLYFFIPKIPIIMC